MLVRADKVTVPVGYVRGGIITDVKSTTFDKYSEDAICIPIFIGAGWLGCTGYNVVGNKLNAYFYSLSGGEHSGEGSFYMIQFVKV